MPNNGVNEARVKPHASSSSSSTSNTTDNTYRTIPRQHQHDNIRWTGMEPEPDDSNDTHNVSAERIIFDDDASAYPTIDNTNAGPSSKHNTSSDSLISSYSSGIRSNVPDAAAPAQMSPTAIFKQQLCNVHQESMAGSHNPSASWFHIGTNLPDRWDIFSSLRLTPEPTRLHESTGFTYPTSKQYLQFNAEKEHKRIREENDGTIYKVPTKLICINGEDLTDAYYAGNKEHAKILQKREKAFYNLQTIHKINEKYSMQGMSSRVTLVKTEVEENKAGQKVNKLSDFDYPLPNFYFEDNLEEYIKGLRQRFSKHDPETEMEM